MIKKKREIDPMRARVYKMEPAIGSRELETRVTEEYLRNIQEEEKAKNEPKSIWAEMFSFGGKEDPEHKQSDKDKRMETALDYIDYVLSTSKFDIHKVEVPDPLTLSLTDDDEVYFRDGPAKLSKASKVALLRAFMLKK